MQKTLLAYILDAVILVLLSLVCTSCEEQTTAQVSNVEQLTIKLTYDQTENLLSNARITPQEITEKNEQLTGEELMRVILRAYPIERGKRATDHIFEKTFTKRISEGYDCQTQIELPAGEYELLVWSDLLINGSPLHNADDFSEVTFYGDHIGCTFCREAFRGSTAISVFRGEGKNASSYDILMKKPLARFELLSDDLAEFLSAEIDRRPGEKVNLDDYVVAFYYVGFMPVAYSLFKDAPVDSSTGAMFTSSIKSISETEASLGFDYVFVNNKDSAVTVRIGVYDNKGELVSLTKSIKVPLKRDNVTVLRGNYITQVSADGILIDTEYNGDHNLFL